MIIVEGPDGAGKSTLVGKLITEFGFTVGERATADRKLLYTVTRQDTHKALAHAILASANEPARIWDRLFYSEMVYAPTVGRPVEFHSSEQSWIQRIIEAARFPVILCLPPLEIVRDNALKNDQMDGVNSNIETIWQSYIDMWQERFFPPQTLLYDYTDDPGEIAYKNIVDEIQDYLDEREERTW